MSKWLEKALAAVAADNAVSKPVLPNVINAKNAKIAKNPLVQRPEENDSQQHPSKPNFGNFGNFDNYGKRQKQFESRLDGLPRYWTKAFETLAATPCPSYVAPERWQQIIDDADQLRRWAPMLAAMGWTLPDVLGRDRIDHLSLVWLVKGQRIGPITSIAVTLRGTDGSTTWVYRRVET